MLWSGGDQEAAPPSPREVALSKDHILQPSSSQVKVKAFRILGRSGWGDVAMLCSDPHRYPSARAPTEARM